MIDPSVAPREDSKSASTIRRAYGWTLTNWDSVATLVAAGVFAVLGIVGGVSDDVLRAATLAVLGLLSVKMLRLGGALQPVRRQTARIERSISGLREETERMRSDVSALETGAPWRVLECRLTWDLRTRDVAHFTKIRHLHFYRNDVMALHDWFQGDGTSENERARPGRFLREPKLRLEERDYSLIALPHRFNRGDEETFEVTRVIHDGFPSDQEECISVAVLEETLSADIKAIWPLDKPPTRVWVMGKKINKRDIPLGELSQEPDGRRSYHYELRKPAIGDDAYIFWNW